MTRSGTIPGLRFPSTSPQSQSIKENPTDGNKKAMAENWGQTKQTTESRQRPALRIHPEAANNGWWMIRSGSEAAAWSPLVCVRIWNKSWGSSLCRDESINNANHQRSQLLSTDHRIQDVLQLHRYCYTSWLQQPLHWRTIPICSLGAVSQGVQVSY